MNRRVLNIVIVSCAFYIGTTYGFKRLKKHAQASEKTIGIYDTQALAIHMDIADQALPQEIPEQSSQEDVASQQGAPRKNDNDSEEDITLEEIAEDMSVEEDNGVYDAYLDKAGTVPLAISAGDREFNPEAKEKDIIELVEKAGALLKNNSLDKAFTAIMYDPAFKKGEVYLFVYDPKGTALVHAQDRSFVWQNIFNIRDTYGNLFIQDMIARAKAGGGWVIYQWRNATKKTYVQEYRKDDRSYIIGGGYYPHSKQDSVVTLVKGAVSVFNETLKEGRTKEEAFSTLSYPLGKFVLGDLYLYAVDFNGLQLAHGEIPGVIGTNVWNYRDAAGTLVNQNIIARLKDTDFGIGIWVEYLSKNAPKRAYAEKVVDKEGKLYFIACGYYPDADRDQVINLVQRGYRYMKGNGESQAVRAFSDKNDNSFRYGDLYLTLFDTNGLCIAHGNNPSLIGTNMYNLQDSDGSYYVREMIKKAKGGGGWVDYKDRNAFKAAYVEKINLGVKEFVIMCGLYPVTKREAMIQLVKSGADYLRNHDVEESFRAFSDKSSKFIRGDLSLFVLDSTGVNVVNGDNFDFIWKNMMSAKDDSGKPYVKFMINTAQRGPGIVTFNLNGAQKINFVEQVEKAGRSYIISSGFYH